MELHVVGRGRVAVSGSSDFHRVAIEGVAAKHFRLCVSERTRDALARLRATGRRYTRILPYGYQATADGRLVPEPAEPAVPDQLRARVAAGESYRAIARSLAAAGIVNRAGRPFPFRALAKLVACAPIGHRGTPSLKASVPRPPLYPVPVAHRVAESWLWIGVVALCLLPLVGYLVAAAGWWVNGPEDALGWGVEVRAKACCHISSVGSLPLPPPQRLPRLPQPTFRLPSD